MQSDIIDIFTSDDMENMSYFLVKHSHLYNKY